MESKNEAILFSPALYIQRYMKISQLIEEYGNHMYSKIVDIGCAEFGMFPYLKRIPGVKDVIFVDKDKSLLELNYRRLNPLAADMLKKREEPLEVTVLSADARQRHDLLNGADAILMIEFIEHLYEEDLDHIVQNIFGLPKPPRLILITTPNADYNPLFSSLPSGQFRHYDHKFEWTKFEFENWCSGIINDFPHYEVCYDGCGFSPEGISCSQIAIFTLRNHESLEKNQEIMVEESLKDKEGEFKCCSDSGKDCDVLHRVVYPFDNRSYNEKTKDLYKQVIGSLYLQLKRFICDLDYGSELNVKSPHLNSHLSWSENIQDSYSNSKENDELGPTSNENIVKETKLQTSADKTIIHAQETFDKSELVNLNESDDKETNYNDAKFQLKSITTDLDSFLRDSEQNIQDTFLYFDNEDFIIFTIPTFFRWAGISISTADTGLLKVSVHEIGHQIKIIGEQEVCLLQIEER